MCCHLPKDNRDQADDYFFGYVGHPDEQRYRAHRNWSQGNARVVGGGLVEVGRGCWLLETKLGAAFVTPIVIIIICTALLSYAMTLIAARQMFWMENIQKRVAFTANAISEMKYFKMMGMTGLLSDIIQRLRLDEIRAGNKFGMMLLVAVALSFIPTSLSPAITFAVTFKELDAAVVFVSLSFIMLQSSPLTNLFQSLPVWLATFASFKRIETYLAEDPREDFRQCASVSVADGQDLSNTASAVISENRKDYETSSNLDSRSLTSTQPAFKLINASYSCEEDKPVLKDLDISIPRGSSQCSSVLWLRAIQVFARLSLGRFQ